MINDKIWDVCRDVESKSGGRISGLRDLFDTGETTYSNTTAQDKIEIIQEICKKAKCGFTDIYLAFMDCYDNERYQHIMPESKKGICKIYAALYNINSPETTFKDHEEEVEEIHRIYTEAEDDKFGKMVEVFFNSMPLACLEVIISSWQKNHSDSFDFFMSGLTDKIEEKLADIDNSHNEGEQ